MSASSTRRRLILVALNWTRDKDPRVPLGHASLLARMQRERSVHTLSMVRPVNGPGSAVSELAADIVELSGDAAPGAVDVAIGAYVWNEHLVQALLPELRRRGFHGRIILGGPQISYVETGLEGLYPDADLFIRGYAEEALAHVVASPEESLPNGAHAAGGPDLGRVAKPSLDELPSPWLDGVVPLRDRSFLRFETQRGCPYACSFCQHRSPDGLRGLLRRSEDRIREEIAAFVAAGVRDIAVLDPVFNLGRRSVEHLHTFRASGYRGRLSVQCRGEAITPDFLDVCSGLDIYLELGLQTIHADEAEAIGRPNRIDKVEWVIAELRRRDIAFEVSLIFGLPLQTLDSFRASVAWCLERRVPVVKAFPLMLLRGTRLARQKRRWGLMESDDPMPIVLRSDHFDAGDWRRMNALSEALRNSEGRHPASLADLLIEEDGGARSRWTPATAQEPKGERS